VLTEDAVVNEDVHDEVSAREYATTYWSGASESLAQQARTLERLFAVLAGSNEGAGAEFWFARASDLLERVQSLTSTTDDDDLTTRARGDALESLVDALMRTEEPELRVIEKNLRTTEEEIDLVLKNGLSDAFWSTLSSPLILVECKNWSRRAGVGTLRVFESKMQDRGALCRIGIFVSMAGFTEPFLTRLKVIQAEGGVIFAVDGRDLATLVTSKRRISDWLGDEGLRRSLGASTI
jgi:Holliday junction resolvase-like predicted endonuclease